MGATSQESYLGELQGWSGCGSYPVVVGIGYSSVDFCHDSVGL